MASARRVAVTGLGLVSPFGGDLADFFGRMLRGESAIRLYTREDKVTRPLSVPAVRCADFDADSALGRSLAYTMDRYSQLGTTAALSAWRDAGLPRTKDAPRNDWGVSWGTALGGTLTFESGYIELLRNGRERLPPLQFRSAGPGARRRGGRNDPRGLEPRGPARSEDLRRIRGVRQHLRS